MRKMPQTVTAELSTPEGHVWKTEIAGTNTGNLNSKISGWVRSMLIQHALPDGGTFTITIGKAEVDEFANPER